MGSDDESSIPSTTLAHREVRLRSCAPADDLSRWVAAFETRLNQEAYAVAGRLWVKDRTKPNSESRIQPCQ
jgi:hypothetical protein